MRLARPQWEVLTAAFVGMVFGYSAFSAFVFGLFIKPLAAEFQWSRTEITTAISMSTFVVIVLSPLLGMAVDRYGVRKVLLPSIFLFAALLNFTAWHLSTLIEFYALIVLITVAGIATVPTTYTRVVFNWFDLSRGLALAFVLSGVGFAGILLPPLLQWITSSLGWRASLASYGLFALFVSLPLSYYLLRERPATGTETVATVSDMPGRMESAKRSVEVSGLEAKEAMGTPAFWTLVAVFLLIGITTYGSTVHLFSTITDRGITAEKATFYLSFMGLFLIVSRLACGALLDRFHAPLVAFCFIGGMAAGLGLIGYAGEGALLALGIALLGLGIGAEQDLGAYLVFRYFGLKSYGILFGLIYSTLFIGGTIGPIVMALMFDHTASHSIGYIASAGITAVAAALFLLLGDYPMRDPVNTIEIIAVKTAPDLISNRA